MFLFNIYYLPYSFLLACLWLPSASEIRASNQMTILVVGSFKSSTCFAKLYFPTMKVTSNHLEGSCFIILGPGVRMGRT